MLLVLCDAHVPILLRKEKIVFVGLHTVLGEHQPLAVSIVSILRKRNKNINEIIVKKKLSARDEREKKIQKQKKQKVKRKQRKQRKQLQIVYTRTEGFPVD